MLKALMGILKSIILDPFDLTPGEAEIRKHRWAVLGGTSGQEPDWPEIYSAEIKCARALNSAEDLAIALRTSLSSDGKFWSLSEPDIHQAWVKSVDDALAGKFVETMRATLAEVLTARQAFYARVRQETFYRGKVLILSLASLLAAVALLLGSVARLNGDSLNRIDAIVLSLVGGWVGGSFTWLLGNRRTVGNATLSALREVSRWPYTLSRGAIGAISSLVLFLAMSSGVLPSPGERLMDAEATTAEIERATQAFRSLAIATGNEEAKLSIVMSRFTAELRSAFQPGARSRWNQTDQQWMQGMGLIRGNGETFSIREALRRSTDAFWLFVMLCVLAGFSESLAPALVDSSLKKLTGLGA